MTGSDGWPDALAIMWVQSANCCWKYVDCSSASAAALDSTGGSLAVRSVNGDSTAVAGNMAFHKLWLDLTSPWTSSSGTLNGEAVVCLRAVAKSGEDAAGSASCAAGAKTQRRKPSCQPLA